MFKPKAWVWIVLISIFVISFASMLFGGINYGVDVANQVIDEDINSIEDLDRFVMAMEDFAYDAEEWENDIERYEDMRFFSFFAGKFAHSSEFETHETLDLSGVESLNIDAVASDIVVIKGSESKAYYHGRTSGSKKIYVDKSGSTLDVEVERGWQNGYCKTELLITLTEEDYEALSVTSVSGSIEINDISAKDLQIKTTSGSLEYDGLNKKINTAYFKSTSGSIDVSNVKALDQIEVKSTSGSIDLVHCEGDFDINNTSGKISVSGNIGTSDSYIKNTSGKVSVAISDKPSSISAKTTSGSVSINDTTGYTVDEKSKKAFVGQNPQGKGGSLNIKNTSGGIDITIR